MHISPCRPYHAEVVGRSVVRMNDGLSTFKLYFVSIVERDEPARYEWQASTLSPDDFTANFRRAGLEGIGFVTAFNLCNSAILNGKSNRLT